jgi:hypothetical protein
VIAVLGSILLAGGLWAGPVLAAAAGYLVMLLALSVVTAGVTPARCLARRGASSVSTWSRRDEPTDVALAPARERPSELKGSSSLRRSSSSPDGSGRNHIPSDSGVSSETGEVVAVI